MKFFPALLLFLIPVLPLAAQQFTQVNPSLPAVPRPAVTWADYDGDGDLDLLIAGEGSQHALITKIYNNNGGTFADSGILLNPLQVASAAWGDFDNDGDLDLAMTGETSGGGKAMYIYRNNGGSFTAIPGGFAGVSGGSLAWGDYDNDGDLDLLVTGVAGSTAATAMTRLYRNDGNGSFVSVAHPFPQIYLGAAQWGDFDSDGDLDLVLTGSTPDGLSSTVWRNDGRGNFTSVETSLPGSDIGFARWGDYDSDGDLDLLIGGDSTSGAFARIYRNDGGTFVDIQASLARLLWSTADWGDFDNDGDLDLLQIGYNAATGATESHLYRNDGAGVFVATADTFITAYLGALGWADYDNDGDLDFFISGEGGSNLGNKLRLYRNNAGTLNTAPAVPSNLTANVSGREVELSWQAATDAQTPAAGLSYNVRVGTTPGGSEIVAPQSSSTGVLRLPAMGNSQLGRTHRLRGLTVGTTCYWSVQSVDTGLKGSAFAAEGSFTATADAPVTESFVRDAGGTAHAMWIGMPGSTYRVEGSDDLKDWTVVAQPVAAEGSGMFDYIDASANGVARRFYRAGLPAGGAALSIDSVLVNRLLRR